jgi:hypothetical protein
VALKCLDTAAALGSGVGVSPSWCDEFPHLDCLVQGARYKILSVWCECDGVYGVLVAIWTFEALNEVAGSSVPDTDALVERTSCNKLGVGGDGDGGYAIFDAESKDVLACLDIPQANGTITAAGSNSTAITGEVERIDVLVMAREGVPDGSRRNIPYLFIVSLSFKI